MVFLNIGRRLTGKTTLALYLALRANCRIFFLDPRGMVRPIGFEILEAPATVKEIQDAMGEIIDGPSPDGPPMPTEIVLTPGPGDAAMERDFAAMCKELYQWLREEPTAQFVLVVDEIRFVKESLRTPNFEWLLRCANPDRVHIIMTCHRPSDVPTDIRAIANYWQVFRTTQEHDVKVLRERSERLASVVQKLGPREFASWDDGLGELKIYRDPKQWYRPLGEARPIARPFEMGLGDDKVGLAKEKLF